MNRRGTGVIFCSISALLYSTRFLCAAIFGSNVNTWNGNLFNSMLQYVGNNLLILSEISLIVGIIYLILGEVIKENN